MTGAEPDLPALQLALPAWEDTYKRLRPTRPWATSRRRSTCARWGSRCNGRTGRVQVIDLCPHSVYCLVIYSPSDQPVTASAGVFFVERRS